MSVRKDKNNLYIVDVSCGTNRRTNKRKRIVRRGIKTYKEAKIVESDIISRNDESNLFFSELTGRYLTYSKEFDKVSTFLKKESVINIYLNKYFGDYKLNDIDTEVVTNFKIFLNSKDISLNYKRFIFTMLNSIFNYAIKFDYTNAKRFISVKNYKKEKVDMKFWELSDFQKFINFVDDDMFYIFFSLLFLTGMRRGEALALTWKDIDLKKKRIKINKSCSYISRQGYFVSKPKTDSSIRTIFLNDKLVDELIKYKDICKESNILFDDGMYIFSINNEIVSKSRIDRVFKEYTIKANVPAIRLHDLRHSHVALLIHMNEDILAIKKRLGHTDVGITLNVYGHLYDSKDKELASKLDSVI